MPRRMTRPSLLLVLPLGACAEPVDPPAPPAGRTIEVPDGSELVVPERPERVLPANSAATDLLAELVEPERVVALPGPARYWSVVAEEPGPWSDTPVMERLTGEAVLHHRPDLIVASTWSGRAPLVAARRAGVPVIELPDATSWERLVGAVELLGRALGEGERAAEFTRELERRRAALDAASRPARRVLPYANFGQGGSTSGSGTTLDLAIRLAGLENAAARHGVERHGRIGLEQVLTIDPDLFLTASGRDGVAAGASYLRGEPALADLRAVREGRIVVLAPELFSASSHRVLETAEELAEQVDALFGE